MTADNTTLSTANYITQLFEANPEALSPEVFIRQYNFNASNLDISLIFINSNSLLSLQKIVLYTVKFRCFHALGTRGFLFTSIGTSK